MLSSPLAERILYGLRVDSTTYKWMEIYHYDIHSDRGENTHLKNILVVSSSSVTGMTASPSTKPSSENEPSTCK